MGRPRVVLPTADQVYHQMVTKRIDFIGACGELDVPFQTMYKRMEEDPEFEKTIKSAVNLAHQKTYAWYQNNLARIAQVGETKRGQLQATFIYLTRLGRRFEPLWTPRLEVVAQDGRDPVVVMHSDMSAIRQRALDNNSVERLVAETAVVVSSNDNDSNGDNERAPEAS